MAAAVAGEGVERWRQGVGELGLIWSDGWWSPAYHMAHLLESKLGLCLKFGQCRSPVFLLDFYYDSLKYRFFYYEILSKK